jgi:hypothetical protein
VNTGCVTVDLPLLVGEDSMRRPVDQTKVRGGATGAVTAQVVYFLTVRYGRQVVMSAVDEAVEELCLIPLGSYAPPCFPEVTVLI